MWTWQGEGVCQMSILLHTYVCKSYLEKWSTKGEGVKSRKHGLWMTPNGNGLALSDYE